MDNKLRLDLLINYRETAIKKNNGTLSRSQKLSLLSLFEPDFYKAWKEIREERERERSRQVALEVTQKFETRAAKDIEIYGGFYMVIWSRDCDMVESERIAQYSSIKEFYRSESQCEWSEGPITRRYISMEDAMNFNPTTRDRIAEAFENTGQGYWV